MNEDRSAEILRYLTAISTDVGDIRTRLAALETRVAGLDEHVIALDGRVAALDKRVAALDARVAALETKVDEGFTYMRAEFKKLYGVIDVLSQDTLYMRVTSREHEARLTALENR